MSFNFSKQYQDKYLPKFGYWEPEEHIPYTVYFDKARHKKFGVKMNPNNPQQNPNTFSDNVTPVQSSPLQTETKSGVQNGQEALRTNHVCSSSREYGDDVNMNVPVFGNWETGDAVSYKTIFDRARNNKNGVKTNPTNPQQNPIIFSDNVSIVQVTNCQMETKSWVQNEREAVRRKHVCSSSSQDHGDLRRSDDSPWYHHPVNLQVAVESILNRPGRKRAGRHNARSDSRVNRSPLSSWEVKGSTESGNNLAFLAPGRSRQRSVTKGAETPDHIVPKFGDWDESDPTSVDGFTRIFNKMREERLNGTGNVAAAAAALGKPHYKDLKQNENGTFKKCCCFPIPW